MPRPEDRLQIMVAELLRWAAYPEVCWFHPTNEGRRSPREGARAKAFGMRPGVADLILLVRGKGIAIELKPERRPGQRVKWLKGEPQSEEQRNFEAKWRAAGGDYYLCYGYAETVALLDFLRIIKSVKGDSRFDPRTEAA